MSTIRTRLAQLEQQRRRVKPRASLWDVFLGFADPAYLDEPGRDSLVEMLGMVPAGEVPDRIEAALQAEIQATRQQLPNGLKELASPITTECQMPLATTEDGTFKSHHATGRLT